MNKIDYIEMSKNNPALFMLHVDQWSLYGPVAEKYTSIYNQLKKEGY